MFCTFALSSLHAIIYIIKQLSSYEHDIFFQQVTYFIQMFVPLNTPKVQVPLGVSLLQSLLIIKGSNQNCIKDIETNYYIY